MEYTSNGLYKPAVSDEIVDCLNGLSNNSEMLNSLLELKPPLKVTNFTIHTSAWQPGADPIYPVQATIGYFNVQAISWVDITLSNDSIAIAQEAELSPTVVESLGAITLYAKKVPSAILLCSMLITNPRY